MVKSPEPPPLPPVTQQERDMKDEIIARLDDLTKRAKERNLRNAVRLAQQALARGGPLMEHFCEIGRRYGHYLDAPPKPARPALNLIQGGRASEAPAREGH